MLTLERKITITNDKSAIDKPIILYRGDMEVEIKFTISEFVSKYTGGNDVISGIGSTYAQLVIINPIGASQFTDITPCNENSAILKVTAEMINDIEEVGKYDFQIRLFDKEQTSRLSIPPIIEGMDIREPIATEGVVNEAKVNQSKVTLDDVLPPFDEVGDYNKTTWKKGDVITSGKLNKMEEAIDEVNKKRFTTEQKQQLEQAHKHSTSPHAPNDAQKNSDITKEEIETKLVGDITTHTHDIYLTEHQSLEGYATKEELKQKISEIELTPGPVGPQGPTGLKGDVGPQGLQGIPGTPGPKGDKGEQGLQGLQGPTGEKGQQGDKGDTGLQGPKGADGKTPSISIGNVTTVDSNTSASATITGDIENLKLNLSIPKGAKGEPGAVSGSHTHENKDVLDGITSSNIQEWTNKEDKGHTHSAKDITDLETIKGEKGDRGETGPQGPIGLKGDKGEQGLQGLKGDKGDQGDQGLQGATGPKGDKGDKGDTGAQGPQGKAGITPKLSIGEVKTLEPGQQASATITGQVEDLKLNLSIPKGAKGETGTSGNGASIDDTSTTSTTSTWSAKKINDTIKDYTDGKKQRYLTQAEYDRLGEEEKNDDSIVYNITDADDTGITEEQSQQLQTAYEHSQSTHVQSSDIPTRVGQLLNDSDFITKSETDEKVNVVANNILDSLISELKSVFGDTEEPPQIEDGKCTEIRIEPSSLTIDKWNNNYTLTAITTPSEVTEEIIWSCEADGTVIDLTDNKDKTATIMAFSDTTTNVKVKCGSQSFTCPVAVKKATEPEPEPDEPGPCTSISIEPSPLIVDQLMQEFTLRAITKPSQVTESITWSCDGPETSIDVFDNEDGTATVMAYRDLEANVTVRCGSQSHKSQIIVNTQNILTTSMNFNENKLIFNNNGEEYAQNIKAEIFPKTSTEEIVWSVIEGDSSMVRIESTTSGGKVIPLKTGTCKIQGQSGRYKDVCEVVNIQHSDTSLLESPDIKIENYKAILEQGTHTEKFDVSYEPLTMHPQYAGNREIRGEDGITYYLNLFKTGTSKFRVDGMIPDSGTSWKNIIGKNDSTYGFILTPFPKVNGFNFTYDICNKNNSVIKDLFDFSIKCASTAFPALNITENPSSKNTMTQADYADSFFGINEYFSDHFDIKINYSRMKRAFGDYSEYPYRWRNTGVHEVGHSLGIRDNPKHKPSLYDYGASPEKSWYIQPFDLAIIEYYYKNLWNVDITLTQEEINRQVKSNPRIIDDIPEDTYGIQFDFGTFNEDEIIEVSDVIITGQLEFIGKENISIGEDMVLPYNVYKINADTVEKGNLINDELKIHQSIDVKIEQDARYKMYLTQYDNCPCSLVNIEQGIVEVKEV